MFQRPSNRSCARVIAFLSLSTITATSNAAGFFIDQQSVQALGRVNAGAAATGSDPSTIFFNPAGLTTLWEGSEPAQRWSAAAGIQLIVPRATIRDRGSVAATLGSAGSPIEYVGRDFSNPSDPTPIPNVHLAHRLADSRTYIGFGLNVPFGLATKFGNDWFGRYDAIEASLLTLNLTAVAAMQLTDSLSIGGGIDVQYAKSKLVTAIPNPLVPGGPTATTDGRIETTGNAWTPGFNVGLMYRPDTLTRIGAHFRSGMKHKISGDATITGLPDPLASANGTFGAKADLKLPAIGSVGFSRRIGDILLMAQAEWYDWSSFDEIRVRFDDGRPDAIRLTKYRDTWAAAIGADKRVSEDLTLRAGVRFDRTPTVDGYRDTTFPDTNRWWLGVGATYRLTPTSWLDFAFNHVLFRAGQIDVTRSFFDGTPLASVVRVVGISDAHVNTISTNFRCNF